MIATKAPTYPFDIKTGEQMDDLVGEYTCSDNDNRVKVYSVDGKIDELHFADEIGDNWLVIGYADLMKIIKMAGGEI